jgi:hypothetical protein
LPYLNGYGFTSHQRELLLLQVYGRRKDVRIVDLLALFGALHDTLTYLPHKLPAVGYRFTPFNLFVTKTHGGMKTGTHALHGRVGAMVKDAFFLQPVVKG